MARPKVKLDRAGMRRLLKDDQLRDPLREIAERTATRARSSAPVDSGEYQSSITVRSATTDRVVERVIATAPHSALVESRTGNLKRALGG